MTCPVLTPDRLDRALRGELASQERAALLAHLKEPCEGCLDQLEGLPVDRLLERLAGGPMRPVPPRRDRLFKSIQSGLAPPRPARSWSPSWLRLRPALGLAVLLVLAAPALWRGLGKTSSAPWTGEKGASTIGVELLGFVSPGAPSGEARPLSAGSPVDPKAALVFRYRLSERAFLYLVDGDRAEVLWASDEPLGPGEAEIAQGAAALGLPGQRLALGAHLMLIASPGQLAATQVQSRAAGRGSEGAACPRCGIAELRIGSWEGAR